MTDDEFKNGCADCVHFHSFRHDCDKLDQFLEFEDMINVAKNGCPDKETRKQHMKKVRVIQKEMDNRVKLIREAQEKVMIVRHGLNPRHVTMVAPKHCLYNYYSGSLGEKEYPFEKYCGDCEYHNGQSECRYELYVTDGATGNFNDDELHYIQWCCARCGELIQLTDSISYIYNNLRTDTHECPKCKTPHRCLDYDDDDKFTFAVPVKITGNELP